MVEIINDQEEVKEYVRVSFDLEQSDYARLVRYTVWGLRAAFLRRVVALALDKVEKAGTKGSHVIGTIIAGDFDPFK